MEGEGDLVLEINEESLHNKLLEHKNHIGFNCTEGSLIIASGLAFVYTEYSCAMKSHFRKFGNQMSGSGNHLCNYASLLA